MVVPTVYVWVYILRIKPKRCGDVEQVHHGIDWESVKPTIDEVRAYADEWHDGDEGYVAELTGELRSVWARPVAVEEVEAEPQRVLFT